VIHLPRSHIYVCWTEHDENYDNPPMHTLDRRCYVSLEALEVLFLLGTIFVEAIIPLSKRLSMVFVWCPRHTMELRSHKTLKGAMAAQYCSVCLS
jgi:hypothetical protein